MWMQGIFGLKLQNSSKLPPIYAHYTVMQMTKVNSEKGYFMYILHLAIRVQRKERQNTVRIHLWNSMLAG